MDKNLLFIVSRVRNKWFAMVDEGHIDWEERELREIFRSILMTTCDIGAITKPWEVSRKVSVIEGFMKELMVSYLTNGIN